MRNIADGLNVTHDTAHRLFTKTIDHAPNWRVLRDVVRKLAAEAPGRDEAAEESRFHELWITADERPFESLGPPLFKQDNARQDQEDSVRRPPDPQSEDLGSKTRW